MKYHLWIIGCQYNEWDGARLRYFLDSLGLQESDPKKADVIVILACAVRQTAVDRILGRVKNWTKTKELNNLRAKEQNQKFVYSRDSLALRSDNSTARPEDSRRTRAEDGYISSSKLILATGCILDADKKKFAEKGIKFFESGDFETLRKMVGSHNKRSVGSNDEILKQVQDDPSTSLEASIPKKLKSYLPNSCFYVPIMTGCNNFCSYCAVPYTRGREKSRPMEEIIEDVKKLITSGQKEIMLLGQNVNSYAINDRSVIPDLIGDPLIVDSRFRGNDNSKLSDFTILLEKLNDLKGNFEILFISNHPKDMSDDIIEAVAILPKIKKEIHLPLQSGSNKVLQSMNRPYTIKQYLDIVDKIKKAGDIAITTDVIVGYPTETEKDFQKTVEIFKKLNFKQAYINKYSPRAGTAAYKLGDPISWAEKQHRWKLLNDLINR